jgi:outer membrane receptor protein involved in Fe transport
MKFNPGLNSPLDTQAGGWAVYREHIPAVYATLIFERPKFELEGGLRTEYVSVNYEVDPNHNTYHSDGYHYFQPFPNVRMAWKPQAGQRWSLFYNRRVDRPNEFDLRVFPKYDDAEIIKIGNPALKPQYTQNIELGFKKNYATSSIYAAAFQRFVSGTLSRIATQVPGSTILYNIMQNAGNSMVSGVEMQYNVDLTKTCNLSVNATGYRNQIDAFTTYLLYPQPTLYQSDKEVAYSGTVRLNAQWKPNTHLDLQASSAYLAPDIVPQGRTNGRFSIDVGAKYKMGKSQFFVNASDLFNTLVVQKNIQGNGFQYVSKDYYETQVIRVGYGYTF